MDHDKHYRHGGTHIRDDQAASIVNSDGSFEMVLPKLSGDQELPCDQLFIMA